VSLAVSSVLCPFPCMQLKTRRLKELALPQGVRSQEDTTADR
jgi:hypothetical protein